MFPLHAVLFPYARVQLHIFEERYREMIRYCEEFDSPFGVTLIRAGDEVGGEAEPYLVGTAARIEKVHRYPDGRLHVSAIGEWRFRVRKLSDEKAYMVGHVQPLVEMEEDNSNRLDALARRAVESFKGLVSGMIARPDFNIDVQLPEDPTALSFVIANFLQLENLEKQRFLEMTDPEERLAQLIPAIDAQILESKNNSRQRLTSEHVQEWISPN